ncbi:hypothetical protein [Halorhodospira halophila]|uniref:hypothetical protein n=1 Tax=Halorhodospira halophila TaxID=1053 RepID=UPI0011981D85|nr:hypothetical protein [Halorhodospira halophila]
MCKLKKPIEEQSQTENEVVTSGCDTEKKETERLKVWLGHKDQRVNGKPIKKTVGTTHLEKKGSRSRMFCRGGLAVGKLDFLSVSCSKKINWREAQYSKPQRLP